MIREMSGQGIKTVGVTVKPGHEEALKTAHELSAWLTEQGIEMVGEPRIQTKSSEAEAIGDTEFASACDLIVVLGGDGTMISTARRTY